MRRFGAGDRDLLFPPSFRASPPQSFGKGPGFVLSASRLDSGLRLRLCLLDMAHKKSELPKWFPFALAASAVIAIGAGIRSGGRTAANAPTPPPTPPQPPIRQAAVLQDWFTGDYRV